MRFTITKSDMIKTAEHAALAAAGAVLGYLAQTGGGLDPIWGPALAAVAATSLKLLKQFLSDSTSTEG